MVVAAVGCSDDPAPANQPPTDAGADTYKPPVKTDTGAPDTGPAISTVACYFIDDPNAETESQLLAVINDKLQIAYHDALPAVPGACTAADLAVVDAAVDQNGNLNGGVDFKTEFAKLAVSESCKTCGLAEFQTAERGSTDVQKKASRWGASALFLKSGTSLDLPSSRYAGGNMFGCAVRTGVLTDAEASALTALTNCNNLACGAKKDDATCAPSSSATSKYQKCLQYAATKGVCKDLQAAGVAAQQKFLGNAAATAACTGVNKTLAAFCGGAPATN